MFFSSVIFKVVLHLKNFKRVSEQIIKRELHLDEVAPNRKPTMETDEFVWRRNQVK